MRSSCANVLGHRMPIERRRIPKELTKEFLSHWPECLEMCAYVLND